MRPKKVILCVDSNEEELSRRTFLLETWGRRILRAESGKEALAMLEQIVPGVLDLMIAELLISDMDGNELVRRAKELHPTLPCMITSRDVANYDRALASDAFLPRGASSSAELLEKIRIMVARKRGPKRHVPAAAFLAAQEVGAA